MKQDKATQQLKKLTQRVTELNRVIKACGTCVKEIAAVILAIYGLLEFLLRHWPK
jgi:hypothetical protein